MSTPISSDKSRWSERTSMLYRLLNVMRKGIGLSVLLAAILESAWAQKTVHCQDGDHVLIDVKQIAIQYNASSFAGALNGLSALTGRLEVGPKKLQEAAVATQRFNELVKALVVGYNSC